MAEACCDERVSQLLALAKDPGAGTKVALERKCFFRCDCCRAWEATGCGTMTEEDW